MKDYSNYHSRIARKLYEQPQRKKESEQVQTALQQISILKDMITKLETRIEHLNKELAVTNAIIKNRVDSLGGINEAVKQGNILDGLYIKSNITLQEEIDKKEVELAELKNRLLNWETTLKAIREVEGV